MANVSCVLTVRQVLSLCAASFGPHDNPVRDVGLRPPSRDTQPADPSERVPAARVGLHPLLSLGVWTVGLFPFFLSVGESAAGDRGDTEVLWSSANLGPGET